MGSDVRALFLDRELTADFIAMDVTILRLHSLSVREVDIPRSFRRRGYRSGGAFFETECEACFGSFKALATHVLRHHRQMETVSRLGSHESVASLSCGLWREM